MSYTSARFVNGGLEFSSAPDASGKTQQSFISGLDPNIKGADYKDGQLLVYGDRDASGRRSEASLTNFDPNYLRSFKLPGVTPLPEVGVVRYPIDNGQSEYDKRMAEFNSNFQKPDEAAIRKSMQEQAQARIDAINQRYEGIFAQERINGEGRQGQTRSVNSRSGTLGSDFGEQQMAKTDDYNKKVMDTYSQEKANEIAAVFDKFDQRANEEIQNKRTEYLGAFKENLDYLKEKQGEARTDFETIAKSGLLKSLDQLSDEDMNKLLTQTGYSKMTLESVFNASKPKAQQIDYKIEKLGDGSVLFYGQDPTTGQMVTKKFDFDVPANYDLKFATDGTPLLYNKATQELKVADGFKQGQFADSKNDAAMTLKGYSYVKTPAERDALKAQGYEIITNADGRTYAKAPAKKAGKASSGSGGGSGSGGKLTPEEKAFQTALAKQRTALANGASWGTAWDTMKNNYPDIANKKLDTMLNKAKYYTQVKR